MSNQKNSQDRVRKGGYGNYMKILHIASLHDIVTSGVGIVVPQHIRAQEKYADVALMNIFGLRIPNIDNQVSYSLEYIDKIFESNHLIPDIVVFHEVYHIEFCQIASRLCRKKIPYIIIPHGCMAKNAQKHKRLKKVIGNLLLFNRFLKNAVAVQFLTSGEMNNSILPSGTDKFVGTNGVFLPQICKNTFSSDRRNGIYIGRLDPQIKGIDMLTQSIDKKREVLEQSNFHLNMFGPDVLSFHSKVKELILQSDISSFVFLSEAISGEDKKNALLSADIFIQTSRTEGMPMGILEALSYGLPCLVTRGTNLGEIIEQYDAGWVAETTVESIAEKLEQAIMERKKWEIKSKNARRLVEENFAWDKVAKETLENYRQLIMVDKDVKDTV